MKFLTTLSLTAVLASTAFANTVKVIPSIADLNDLDHHQAVSWGFNLDTLVLKKGYAISKATISIKNITNWDNNSNSLFIDLIDNPTNGLKFFADNTNDNVQSDYFTDGTYKLKPGQDITKLYTYHDTNGKNKTENFVYDFTKSQINKLAGYLMTAPGFDVSYKTEYYYVTEYYMVTERQRVWNGNRWVTQNVQVQKSRQVRKSRQVPVYTQQANVGLTFDADCHYWNDGAAFEVTTVKVPDAGSTLGLAGLSLLALVAVRRRKS